MGREPFITRLAFGRSPFEPLNETSEAIPSRHPNSDPSQHTQLYDQRGNPNNPRSVKHGRRLREAQNELLELFGAVKRRRPPSEDLPGEYDETLKQEEREEWAGDIICRTFFWADKICTWWIVSLAQRVLMFRLPNALPFSQLVALQEPAIAYAGFPAHILSHFAVEYLVEHAVDAVRPIDRLLASTLVTRGAKRRLRRWRPALRRYAWKLLGVTVIYPLEYYQALQRLGLRPTWPPLPSFRFFILLSRWSPIQLPLLQSGVSRATLLYLAQAIAPLALIRLQNGVKRWIGEVFNKVYYFTFIRPHGYAPAQDKPTGLWGVRATLGAAMENAITWIVVGLGWGTRPEPICTSQMDIEPPALQTFEVGGTRITDIQPLEIPVARPESPVDSASPVGYRSTDREAIEAADGFTGAATSAWIAPERDRPAELEVTGASSDTEIVDNVDPTSTPYAYRRPSMLSIGPASGAALIFEEELSWWATLPLEILATRLIASHYLAGHGNRSSSSSPLYPVLDPLAEFRSLDFRSISVLLYRQALCGAVGVAIRLGLWGCEYLAVTYIGKKYFRWGTLKP